MKKRLIWIITACVWAVALIAGLIIYFAVLRPKQLEQEQFAQAVQAYRAEKSQKYQAENDQRSDFEVDVAFIGDSLTDGYDLERFYPQYVTSNRGIGGDTTYGLQARMKVSVYDLKPKVVVMLIGGNNLDTMFEDYEELIVGMRENLPQTRIVLVSLTAMGGNWAHKNQKAAYHNVTIRKLADRYDCSFVDLFTPLFDETTGEIYQAYTNDGVHLTEQGYQVYTDALTPVLDTLLAE